MTNKYKFIHMTQKIAHAVLSIGAFLSLAKTVHAQGDFIQTVTSNPTGDTGIRNLAIGELGNSPIRANSGLTFMTYFIYLWRAIITIGALMVLLYFIWGAIEWISAGGDQGKVGKARDKMTQSVIGLIILVSSFTIVAFLSRLLFGDNFDLLNLTLPSIN